MRWVTLFTWILLVAMALPAARVQLISLLGQAVCAVGGLTVIIVFVASSMSAFAWSACVMACVGTVFAASASHVLVEDASGAMRGAKQGKKETAAALEGLELPLFATAVALSLFVALA